MRYRSCFYLLCVLFLHLTFHSSYAFELGMPLRCHYGVDCFIQNYADHGPHDYQCGPLTYARHDGTDFRLRDYVIMHANIPVLASASGTVKAMRDGMRDINMRLLKKEEIDKKGCGNAVVLTHPEGFETTYCHMKQHSITVRPGQAVSKGQILGFVGLSGNTEFPHLHLGVRHLGTTLDPFTGEELTRPSSCPNNALTTTSLWDNAARVTLTYIPLGLLNAFFSDAIPDAETARAGSFRLPHLAQETPMLILWSDIFGLRANNVVLMKIYDENQQVLAEKHVTIPTNKALYFHYIGIKKPANGWKEGTYRGEIAVLSDGKTLLRKTIQLKTSSH